MYFDYLNVLVFAGVGLAFVFVNLIIASVLRPKRKSDVGLETYECGEETIGSAWIQFDIRYYTVALVYVIFAVEIAFLFPWALVLRDTAAGEGAAAGSGIGMFVLVEGLLFIAILLLGLAYVWRKGDLDWVLSYSGPEYRPGGEREHVRLPRIKDLEESAEPDGDDHAAADDSEEEAA